MNYEHPELTREFLAEQRDGKLAQMDVIAGSRENWQRRLAQRAPRAPKPDASKGALDMYGNAITKREVAAEELDSVEDKLAELAAEVERIEAALALKGD